MRTASISLKKNAILLAILIPVCTGIVALSSIFGAIINVLVIGIIFFISFSYLSYRYPAYNMAILVACSFILPLVIKMTRLYEFPFGIATEGLCFTMLFMLLLKKRISGLKTVPGILFLMWIAYQVVELANPYAHSRIASFYSIRSLIPFVSCYFIVYSSVETKRDIYVFLIGWLTFSLLAGMYGLFQEFVGLPSYDVAYTTLDENIYSLLFTWGRIRKFSFFFSPTEFGILMALAGVSGLIIFFYARNAKIKIISAGSSFFACWSMLYTGSRTAMVIVAIGVVLFAGITLHKKVLMMVGVLILLGTAMVLRPTGGAMSVMATAFQGADDPSFMVRLRNRELIRSYIASNPVGYGLGATGALGNKYSSDTFIGAFQTDSEYVRIAVEAGSIGLLLWLTVLTVIFSYGVTQYFKTKDVEWRAILTVALVFLFMVMVAQYTQEIFTSFLIPMLTSSMFAIIAKIGTKI